MIAKVPTDTEIAEAFDAFLERHSCGPGSMMPPRWAMDCMRQLLAETGVVEVDTVFVISKEDYSQHCTAIWNLACIAAGRGWDVDPRPVNSEDEP